MRNISSQQEFDGLFHKKKRYAILGFPKCGTQALQYHLINKLNIPCRNLEIAYRRHGINNWSQPDNIGYSPIIIYRDPVERIWSAYHFFRYFIERKHMSFPEFLEYKDQSMQSIGCNDPIACSDYNRYIQKWKGVAGCEDLIILKFEQAKHFMERHNITENKPQMPQEYRDLVLEKLKRYHQSNGSIAKYLRQNIATTN